jgi:hypothetical protein
MIFVVLESLLFRHVSAFSRDRGSLLFTGVSSTDTSTFVRFDVRRVYLYYITSNRKSSLAVLKQHNMATRTMTAAAATLTQTTSSSSPTKKTAELEVVNYELLNAGDDNEIKKLVHAATSRGIFFLDTSGPSAAQVTADVPKVLAAQCKFFALSRDEKRTFERSEPGRGLVHGYKIFTIRD